MGSTVSADEERQRNVCNRYSVPWVASSPHHKVGISPNVKAGLEPMNGEQSTPKGDFTGWMIWAGKTLPSGPDSFVPLHVDHLRDWCPQVLEYLGLPPGWRFLLARNHE